VVYTEEKNVRKKGGRSGGGEEMGKGEKETDGALEKIEEIGVKGSKKNKGQRKRAVQQNRGEGKE